MDSIMRITAFLLLSLAVTGAQEESVEPISVASTQKDSVVPESDDLASALLQLKQQVADLSTKVAKLETNRKDESLVQDLAQGRTRRRRWGGSRSMAHKKCQSGATVKQYYTPRSSGYCKLP